MIARVLPPEEYGRLEHTGIPSLAPYVRPDDISTVVVEKDGKVVARITVLRATHFEGVWIDPEARNAGTVRSLLKEAEKVARGWTDSFVFAGASDDRMQDILHRMGAVWVPMDLFLLPLGGH